MIDVILNEKKTLINLTGEEEEQIKADLVLPNPQYISAIKFSPYANVAIPKTLAYYTYDGTNLVVPRGYDIPFPHQIINDQRLEVPVKYPKVRITPRQMQIEAIESFAGKTDSMLISPTGSGKSVMVLLLLAKIKNKALVIVHKDDLVSGWIEDIKKCFSLRNRQVGLIKAQDFRIGNWITVSTVQTLSKLPKDKLEELHATFGVIVVDELHHSPANTWSVVGNFPAKYRIGVSATPTRNDGLGKVMNFYFGEPCFVYKESEENKDIIPPSKVSIKRCISGVYYNPPEKYVDTLTGQELKSIFIENRWESIYRVSPEYLNKLIAEKKIKRKALDYMEAKKTIQNDTHFNKQVCIDVKNEFLQGKSCLVFCFEKEHCRIFRQTLLDLNIPENFIQLYYGDATESKEEMKAKAESREKLITIATYAIATEGTNVRAFERLFFGMNIGNAKDTIQAIGRGRRTSPGKTDLIVYDYMFPNVKGMKNHWLIREKVYKEIGFQIK